MLHPSVTLTGKQRKKRLSYRERKLAITRANAYFEVERICLRSPNYYHTSECLWHFLPHYMRTQFRQHTFYKWLRLWGERGILEVKYHRRGWFVYHSFRLPESTLAKFLKPEFRKRGLPHA